MLAHVHNCIFLNVFLANSSFLIRYIGIPKNIKKTLKKMKKLKRTSPNSSAGL